MAVETEEQREARLHRMRTNQSDRLAAETEEQAAEMRARLAAELRTSTWWLHHTHAHTLFRLGVNGKCWRLIKDWYSNTRSVVRVNNQLSESFPVKRSVKQGSVLSPTLFIAVMDSLLSFLESSGQGPPSLAWMWVMLMTSELPASPSMLHKSRETLLILSLLQTTSN